MLIRQTILYLPAQLLGPLFQFIAAVVWTHWMSADAYGVLTYVLASHELIYISCLGWWSQYVLRFGGTFADADARRQFQATEFAVMLLGAPAQAIVAVALLISMRVPLTVDILVCSIVCCIGRCWTTHVCERARATGRIFVYTIAQSAGPIFGFAIALTLVRFAAPTPAMALAGFALAQAAVLLWAWRQLDLPKAPVRLDRNIIVAAVKFGAPLLCGGTIAWVGTNCIRVIVEHISGAEAVGLISVGWGLGQRLSSVVAMLVTAAAFPLAVRKLVDGSRDAALRQLADGGAILFGLVAPATVGIMLVSRGMTEIMIAQPFWAVTFGVLPVAAIAGGVRNLRMHFCDQAIILFERTDLTVSINVVEAIASVAFCALGLQIGGLTGAALGCLAGAVAGAVYAFALGVTRFGLIIPWDHVARISIATAVMAATLMSPFINGLAGGPQRQLLLDIVVGGAAYVVALAALYPRALAIGFGRLRAA